MIRIIRPRVQRARVPLLLLLLLHTHVFCIFTTKYLIGVGSSTSDALANVHLVLGHLAYWAGSVS